jgi:ribonucleotide reductase alpha subunit
LDINHNLVNDLTNLGIWERVKGQIIELQGDISTIEEIPQHIKDVYKTSFTTSPYAFIEIAARAQKWIDQALSRNMYLDTRDIEETMKIYSAAWGKGVKTTYYLHMKPRHTAEQSTTNVNKATKIGKIGFGALNFATSPAFSAPLQKSMEMSEPVAPAPSPFSHPVAPVFSNTAKIENISIEEEILVSVSTKTMPEMTYVTPEAPKIVEKMVVEEVVLAPKPSRNEYASLGSLHNKVVGPEDPAEDENNVCISCQ